MKKFLIGSILVLACSSLEAKIEYRYSPSKEVYSFTKEKPTKSKSVRKIIREILGKRKKSEDNYYLAPPLELELDNTIPIPAHDFDILKNLA